jgi:hypothetical protein
LSCCFESKQTRGRKEHSNDDNFTLPLANNSPQAYNYLRYSI